MAATSLCDLWLELETMQDRARAEDMKLMFS